ncbi:MAG: glycosyltransferase [Thermodesulfobacteriota bacterium]
MSAVPILFLIYDLEPGGPELRLLDLARSFPEDRPIHICVTSRKVTLLPQYLACPCHVSVYIEPVEKAYLDIAALMRIYRYVRRHGIRIVNSYDIKGLILATAIRMLSGNRVVTVHHTVDLLHNFSQLHKVALRILLRWTTAVLCNAHFIRRVIEAAYVSSERIHVVYNGIDAGLFRKNVTSRNRYRRNYSIDDDETVIGTLANFRKEKHYPFLLDAFCRIRKHHPRTRLLCVGGGPEFDSIRSQAVALGLTDGIFTGYVEDVAGHLSAMDLFVFCSLHEGLPNAILQAMSMELPIVSTAVGGICELIVDGEDGLLVPPNNQDAFLKAVFNLLDHPERRAVLGRRAREKVLMSFSLKAMVEGYDRLFRQLVPSDGGSL